MPSFFAKRVAGHGRGEAMNIDRTEISASRPSVSWLSVKRAVECSRQLVTDGDKVSVPKSPVPEPRSGDDGGAFTWGRGGVPKRSDFETAESAMKNKITVVTLIGANLGVALEDHAHPPPPNLSTMR